MYPGSPLRNGIAPAARTSAQFLYTAAGAGVGGGFGGVNDEVGSVGSGVVTGVRELTAGVGSEVGLRRTGVREGVRSGETDRLGSTGGTVE